MQSILDRILEQILDGTALAEVDGGIVGLILIKNAVHLRSQRGYELVMQEIHHRIQPQLSSHGLIPEDIHEVVASEDIKLHMPLLEFLEI